MGSYMEIFEARVLGENLYLHQRFTQCSKWSTSCILFRSCCNLYTPSFNKVCYALRLQSCFLSIYKSKYYASAGVYVALGGSFIVYPFNKGFIVDNYCSSFYCRPLLFIVLFWPLIFILLVSTFIVYPFCCRSLLFILLLSITLTEKLHSSLIFISGGQVVASADFDFTLLYKLIRNLLTANPAPTIPAPTVPAPSIPAPTVPTPTCGWGNQPSPGHLNETDDIERIRHVRNCIAHSTDLEIRDANFSTHWSCLSQVK